MRTKPYASSGSAGRKVSVDTDAINGVMKEERARPLDEVYPIMYVDAIRLRIRDGSAVRIKACHIANGEVNDGSKQVLGMWIEQTEGARFWAGVLTVLRNRGRPDRVLRWSDGPAAHLHRDDRRCR